MSTRVYVGNLSWKVKWQELKDHMKCTGEVVRADVFEDNQGRSKGCGIVEFSSHDAAQKAIKEMNDTMLCERLMFVREDREDGSGMRTAGPGGSESRGRSRPPPSNRGYRGGGGGYRGGGGMDRFGDNDRYGNGGGDRYGNGGGDRYGNGGGDRYGNGGGDRYGNGGGDRYGNGGGDRYGNGGGDRYGHGGGDRYGHGGGDRYAGNRGGGGGGYRAEGGNHEWKIFVSNLPYKTSWQDLKDFFRASFEVIRADVLTFPDGKSRGVGVVHFHSEQDAIAAIEQFHDFEFEGRKLGVRMDRGN